MNTDQEKEVAALQARLSALRVKHGNYTSRLFFDSGAGCWRVVHQFSADADYGLTEAFPTLAAVHIHLDRVESLVLLPDQLAEQYGSNIAINALNAMLTAGTQAERCTILHEALKDLCDGGNEYTARGFAVALVNVIERGLGVEA